MQSRSLDGLIDRFVAAVNHDVRPRIREEDIPVQLREGGARFGLYYSWTIQRATFVEWIDPTEKRLGFEFPPSYRSFVSRYIFPAFEASYLALLGNTGQALYNELSHVLWRDPVAARLLNHGFIQFARSGAGESDPICLDANRPDSSGEFPVVEISYQQALLAQQPQIVCEWTTSFGSFVESYLEEKLTAPAECAESGRT